MAMLFVLAGYFYLAAGNRLPGAGWIVAGIVISILAAAIQAAAPDGVVIIWGLDHNGVFHMVQMVGVPALVIGLKTSLARLARVSQPA
jgi:hypothetical protein